MGIILGLFPETGQRAVPTPSRWPFMIYDRINLMESKNGLLLFNEDERRAAPDLPADAPVSDAGNLVDVVHKEMTSCWNELAHLYEGGGPPADVMNILSNRLYVLITLSGEFEDVLAPN